MANSLTFFPVSGDYRNVNSPQLSGSTNADQIEVVTGFVFFGARLPLGFQAYVDDYDLMGDGTVVRDTAISFPIIQARIWEGRLSTIDVVDTPGVQLVSNSAILGLADRGIETLVYDVWFDGVIFAEDTQFLTPFAFEAPVGTTPICLTDPDLLRLPYMDRKTYPVDFSVANVPDGVYLNDDGEVVFTSDGQPIGQPLELVVEETPPFVDGGDFSSPGAGTYDGGTL